LLDAERTGASGFRSIPPAGLLGGKGGGDGGGAEATNGITDVTATASGAREPKNILRTLDDAGEIEKRLERVEASQI
jgi:hypothetical protein